MAAVNKNTIVIVHSVGPIILEPFVELPNVKAIVWAGLSGQEAGNSLVDVLYGDVSPSGKLPYTIAKKAADYGTTIQANTDSFSEGLFIDYRYLDKNNIVPRYEFGYGLCESFLSFCSTASLDLRAKLTRIPVIAYTNFTYTNLTINPSQGTASGPVPSTSLYDAALVVWATVSNTGNYSAAEVAQLYITFPSAVPATPIRQLRGFEKEIIRLDETVNLSFTLRKKDLSFWDTAKGQWVISSGSFGIAVGASSRDLRLKGNFDIA